MSTITSTMSAQVSAAVKPRRIRFYRDFLTPSLHRKFTGAAGIVLLVCYVESILLSERPSPWSWTWSGFFWTLFPISRVGIRALLLFISAFVIFILRVGQLRFGERTATSTFKSFLQLFTSILQTLAFYTFSAWWFSEIYVWSASEGADLAWVKQGEIIGTVMDRDRLNERPIILRSNLFVLAFAETVEHFYNDFSQAWVQLPQADNIGSKPLDPETPPELILKNAPRWLSVGKWTAITTPIITFVLLYPLLLRGYAWSWSLWFARLIWDVPRSAEPPLIPPYHYTVIFRAFTSSFLLVCLWELTNLSFGAFVGQPPVKRGKPLTADSRDPNGSLLNGLNSKKNLVKANAFWELYIISATDETRRKTIFSEVDRSDASTWQQVLGASLAVIEDINTRLIDTQSPPPEMTLQDKKKKDIKVLPRLADSLKEDPILASSPRPKGTAQWAENRIGALAKSISQKPTFSDTDSPTRKAYKAIRDRALSKESQEALQPDNVASLVVSLAERLLWSPFGIPFRETFARRTKTKILGTPRSELPVIVFSIDAIARLAAAGITEDAMGTVYKDIPVIMRTFGNIIGRIRTFIQESPVHWTDVEFDPAREDARRVEEVEFVVGHLRAALRHIITGYERYARDMGIAPGELRAAKLAAGLQVS